MSERERIPARLQNIIVDCVSLNALLLTWLDRLLMPKPHEHSRSRVHPPPEVEDQLPHHGFIEDIDV